jgi:hypothetical protein
MSKKTGCKKGEILINGKCVDRYWGHCSSNLTGLKIKINGKIKTIKKIVEGATHESSITCKAITNDDKEIYISCDRTKGGWKYKGKCIPIPQPIPQSDYNKKIRNVVGYLTKNYNIYDTDAMQYAYFTEDLEFDEKGSFIRKKWLDDYGKQWGEKI